MNSETVICLLVAGIFLFFAIIFAILKEKVTTLITAFNTMPRHEQEKYNKLKISESYRNSFLIWATCFFVGAVLSYFMGGYIIIPTFAVWLLILLKDYRKKYNGNPQKAFEKYLL